MTDRIASHRDFLNNCIKEKVVPKGLRIKKKCLAFKATTEVQDQFTDILARAEEELIELLHGHYENLLAGCYRRLDELSASAEVAASAFREEDPDAVQLHNDLMKKTRANLAKAKTRRKEGQVVVPQGPAT